MPAQGGIDMMQRLMQQLMGGQFAQQQIGNLQGAGLGKVKAKKMFATPPQETELMNTVLQRVLGYYGGGSPQNLPGFGMPMGRQMGPQELPQPTFGPQNPQEFQRGGMPAFGAPNQQLPQEDVFGGGMRQGGGIGIPSLDNPQKPFTSGATSVEDMINRLFDQNQAAQDVSNVAVASQNPWEQIGLGGGLPNLDPNTQNQLGAIFQPQMDQMNSDFGMQKDQMLQDLFGRGMNASTAATDAGGKLLTGRSTAMNQILGQKAQAELALRQQLMEQIGSKAQAGAFRGGANLPGGMGGSDSPAAGMLSSVLHDISGSDRALNFDQRMQQADMELRRAALEQQGALGGRGLDIQQLLGLGGQDIQRQGMGQDLMSQLLGMGLQRQQSAAGLQSSEAARMQQYLMGQQSLMGGLGSQQAQMEAQRRSLLSQILGGVASMGGSLLGGAMSGGLGLSQIFSGRPA